MTESKKKLTKDNMETEKKDESFEIISEKEKLWRDFLVSAETNFIKSEASVLQNKAMIDLAEQEIKKESDKNK